VNGQSFIHPSHGLLSLNLHPQAAPLIGKYPQSNMVNINNSSHIGQKVVSPSLGLNILDDHHLKRTQASTVFTGMNATANIGAANALNPPNQVLIPKQGKKA
jgi:hypothetical protein